MDDEFDLLRDGSPAPERRPAWLLVGALVAVVLLVLVGVVWMVSSVSGRGGTVTAAASSPATTSATALATTPAPTPAPTTTLAATTAAPTTTAPRPTATFRLPLPSAATVAPSPTPRRTPAPTSSRPPVPRPVPPTPVGKPVPGVIGLRVSVATAVLRAQGFKVQVLGGVLGPDRDDRRVTAQRPGPGAFAPAGATVILVTDGI